MLRYDRTRPLIERSRNYERFRAHPKDSNVLINKLNESNSKLRKNMVSKICKRCDYAARLDDPFNRGFGAISRTDNKSQICSDCGVEEAMENFIHGAVTPRSQWPVYK